MKNCFAFIAALAVAGCVSMSPEAQRVIMHSSSSTIVGDCSRLGSVTGEASLWNVMTIAEGYQQAKNNLRENAYRQYQADTVVLVNIDQFTTSVVAQGIAFKCD